MLLKNLGFVAFITCNIFLVSCGENFNIFTPYKTEKIENVFVKEPLMLFMPSANYNKRPENTKIDTIIIHHTAPFASLTRVGYYFQDINSRVSAHYTVGKEGLIIKSVDDSERAWQAGPSSWLGKYNVNDYSVGIEILNNGDSKDPFTEPQYNALSKLVAYLMKKHNVPISRVIGHRDIAFPLGRKIDPADNFDWKLFKSKIRVELMQPQSFWGLGELPQDSNTPVSKVRNDLYSTNPRERMVAVDNLLTISYKKIESDVNIAFQKETDPAVKSKYFRLFEIYTDNNYIESALKIFENLKKEDSLLVKSVITYLFTVDKNNSIEKFLKAYNDNETPPGLKVSLINTISNYKENNVKTFLVDELSKVNSPELKKALIEGVAKYEDKTLNDNIIQFLDNKNTDDIRTTAIENLRLVYDEKVENKLIKMVMDKDTGVENSRNYSLLESIAGVLLRKESRKGINLLQQDSVYNQLSVQMKTALINSLGKLKITEAEDWIIQKAESEGDNTLKISSFIALGRIKGDKSFDYLYKSLQKEFTPEVNFIILKSLSNFDNKIVRRAILKILGSNESPYELKVLAISSIRENKFTDLLPQLKEVFVMNKDPILEAILEDAIKQM